MGAKPESKLRKKIKDTLNTMPLTKVWTNHGSVYGETGRADLSGFVSSLLGVWNEKSFEYKSAEISVHFSLEVKMPGKIAKKHQLVRQAEIRSKGGICEIVETVEEAIRIVKCIQNSGRYLGE